VRLSNYKGAVAEMQIAAAATRLGVPVLRPLTEHGRYDLAFELGSRLLRVQCKWAALDSHVVTVRLGGSTLTNKGYVRRLYSTDEVDLIAAYCGDLGRCYVIPIEVCAGQHAFTMRLTPPKNGQRAAINSEADFRLPGAIAQLGERRHGMAEVAGSSPAGSTDFSSQSVITTVGAHEFRNHFGWYMQRAAAGEEILVTRRGRPTVRLLGTNGQPTLLDEPPGGRIEAGRGSTSHETEPQ
jgi:prevent-host-death family protein